MAKTRRVVYIGWLSVFTILLVAVVLWLLGWSFWPFGKHYLPNYYFIQLHEHHKNYFPEGERLVLLNGSPVDSIREKNRVGITRATRIIEYSSSKAIERFGDAGKFGATEIMGEEAEWIVSDAAEFRRSYSQGMFLTHTGASLPNRMSPGHQAIYIVGESVDTLYLGVLRYRHVVQDTVNKVVVIDPSRMFFVNLYKRKAESDKPLLVFRNGRLEASFTGVRVEGMGGNPYLYDERVVAFGRWVDNTVSAVMNRHRKTGKVKDGRLIVINGDVYDDEQSLIRIQATRGTLTYLNGIDAVKMFGWKGAVGAVLVTGNSLTYFGQEK